MKYLKRFISNARRSPKTTASGLAGLIGSLAAARQNPAAISSPEWWTVVLVSGGLLFAGDAKS